MATAAADFLATPQVSPELVLVDAALGEELRLSLDTPPASPAVAVHVVSLPPPDLERDETVAIEIAAAPAESSNDVDASGLVAGPIDEKAIHGDTFDLIVGSADDAAHESEAASGYPSLPAPEDADVDPMEAAEAALREIRARMTTDAPETRRVFRTRFTVALGGSAFCAVAALVAHVHYGIAQLPL